MLGNDRNPDASDAMTIGLHALGWVITDTDRAQRMLAVTGLDPDDLRARAGDPALLAAILAFLEAHEPDLIACATALDVAPATLTTARRQLEG